MSPLAADGPLWTPSAGQIARANVSRFIAEHVRPLGGPASLVRDSHTLHAWSIAHPEPFWAAVWRFTGVIASRGAGTDPWDEVLVGGTRMAPPDAVLGPRWFTGSRLNFAENLLRRRDDGDALILWTEEGASRRLTFSELVVAVTQCAGFLRRSGVRTGDRVAAVLPNVPEAVVAMLATASIGALWSSCSPDFGVNGVLDRFGQIAPRVLIAADGYRYGGQSVDSIGRLRELARSLPSVEQIVVVPNLAAAASEQTWRDIPRAVSWDDALEAGRGIPLTFERLPFDHPLYILYSSGTTGLPKCIVHGAGGTLVQHLKELVLHTDLRDDDRIFYYTTCGWMMWNWLVSSLAVGATVVLYDGAPILRGRPVLWDLVATERVSVFGTSAKWIGLTEKEGTRPRHTHDLTSLRAILSTGSPLAEHSFDFIYEQVKPNVMLSSISGGTDIVSCFALGDPTLPVHRGEMQTRGYGMAVKVFDEGGASVVGTPGELVCTAPFPSMPVGFWNDDDRGKYRAAYFETFAGVWRHGDWAELTPRGGLIILGRSDATLNPAGVRIGTAEIYRQVELLPEVVECVVIGQEQITLTGRDVRIVLFVRLRAELELDEPLRERIRRQIRDNATAHHVPRKILQVADIPRTISGKISELAVREVVHGRQVRNADALANPDSLELFRGLAALDS